MPTGETEPHLRELGAFFKVQRDALDPAAAGVGTAGERRRVRGLRREEVAQLASISSDYYARIEQGRLAPSPRVLDALVVALGLDEDQSGYARELVEHAARAAAAGPPVAPGPAGSVAARTRTARPRVRPQLQRLLDRLDEAPALVFGPRLDVLAWNEAARRVYLDFSAVAPADRNYVRLVFTRPEFRELFADWAAVARACVAILRREAVANPADPELAALVGELTIADRRFGQWWSARSVTRQDFGTKVLNHPVVGELTLDWDFYQHTGTADQQLVVHSCAPGSPTEERLRRLCALDD